MELALSYCKKDNIIFLPNLPWAKRVYGMLASFLVKKYKIKPIAILVDIGKDNYLVSVRAPLNKPTGVGDLCRLFDSGGGRAAAGGINRLHKSYLEKFIQAFLNYWT
jgi:single-stranded DNA-specific DHH superfamily exonuclease